MTKGYYLKQMWYLFLKLLACMAFLILLIEFLTSCEHKDLCYEKCTVTDKKEDFPLTPDGLTSCIKWLYEKYESTYEA